MPTLEKNGHTISTELPREVAQLRAEGYREVKAPRPAAAKTESK